MTAAIGRAAIAPVLEGPDPRSALASQLLAGEAAQVTEELGAWRHLVLTGGTASGWVHSGYLVETSEGEARAWQSRAAWSSGVLIQEGTVRRWMPLRGRLALADGDVELPGGGMARIIHGEVRPLARVQSEARRVPPEEWALGHFAGAPYLWGGITPGGVDCSGLVQTTFLARGIDLPRNAARQSALGTEVPRHAMRAGDLIFFHGETGSAVEHVAFAGSDATVIHASLAAGGVVRESWLPGAPAAALMERVVALRRIHEASGGATG
ncbi:MAG: C40 family peptidase [Gemmatimonadota bacterium]|nr:C40 family peptidase [Gemmatimonadota bacterium]